MNSYLSSSHAAAQLLPSASLFQREENDNRLIGLVDGDVAPEGQPKTRGITLHIIDGNSASRAQMARLAIMGGLHAEIYADCDELLQCSPTNGIVLCVSDPGAPVLTDLMDKLLEQGTWLPVIAYSQNPSAREVVDTIKMGAIDYLVAPLDLTLLNQSIERVFLESKDVYEMRTQEASASEAVARLTPREQQVLGGISSGNSNKAIARDLDISPRTVEIHRMKMMAKLGVHHAAGAVRIQLLAHGRNALAI